jgi:hypothetical protein
MYIDPLTIQEAYFAQRKADVAAMTKPQLLQTCIKSNPMQGLKKIYASTAALLVLDLVEV